MERIARDLARTDPALAWRLRHHTLDRPPRTPAVAILGVYLFGGVLLTAGLVTSSLLAVAAGAVSTAGAAAAIRRVRRDPA
ncbi:DUF3040 domain-containing protein [Phytohabitans sp. ZYX-F-186]|uniref:DUF3040 domain-containing protein n=1 Tax=Phytohabitans maris TaxID=3071409 RepID=A0ABU0ZT31_9ACTN|nr:DUF3040 domain-containing protein [Phytohabitans sp. ZYX-F-186]MDQ7909951.1 DUF3040 domain-containing protein [Phytohabitans sp. ZYX-F-186]